MSGLVFPYNEIENRKEIYSNEKEYLDALEFELIDSLESLSEYSNSSEDFDRLNVAITGFIEFFREKLESKEDE